MTPIVVLGAGIGGMPAAYDLRKRLGRQHEVTLIKWHGAFSIHAVKSVGGGGLAGAGAGHGAHPAGRGKDKESVSSLSRS